MTGRLSLIAGAKGSGMARCSLTSSSIAPSISSRIGRPRPWRRGWLGILASRSSAAIGVELTLKGHGAVRPRRCRSPTASTW